MQNSTRFFSTSLKILFFLANFSCIWSCQFQNQTLVNQPFCDSLMQNFSSKNLDNTEGNLLFWQKRCVENTDYFVNVPKLAEAYAARFRVLGDVQDLRTADSLFQKAYQKVKPAEPAFLRSLVGLSLQGHQFQRADSLLQLLKTDFPKNAANNLLDFDVSFERGNYTRAKFLLNTFSKQSTFAYLFRKSKYEHYEGQLDSAVVSMQRAANRAGQNVFLSQIAWSNAGDLQLHNSQLAEAASLYEKSLRADAGDFHSLAALGWIALVHDKNAAFAEKTFRFIQKKQHSPEMWLKLIAVAQSQKDSISEKKYARQFVEIASKPIYGQMYDKYLIDIFTETLPNAHQAVALAEKETVSRPTPQSYAWLAYSLFCENRKEEAYKVFQEKVSGKPLEALELFYMAKMMQGLGKTFNAQQFFDAAKKNRYDLSPKKIALLEEK